ncbi:type II toxin-antitoxin system HicB family antitoxin [Varunaivibrio sulfuroxidans]|uniref:Antitoxin HicB n=1 Tax=Varunaivibrio sulfuroxidans TaxID=1773489 RepID=A0A4R3J6A5_9PROT|nr:type II toxin-antitoxin system HicB family antitoxin [Varunaivibrio sulfuroxidans]TCS59970.1 antitoxin HicB [Varunaivibrio sulfuroxidans]WES31747.1 type II toxin-antitoxin system HicB family antitoxin [Varunaivibrio sulfuroxidans]
MRYAYPCNIIMDDEGWLIVSFPDVSEALTSGKTRDEAIELAEDALAVALAGYVHNRRDIPAPSPAGKGQDLIPLPPVVAAKLALYSAMRARRMTKVALAARLGVSESAVRKLVDPDHRSHISRVERALKLLGRALVVEDKAA